MTQHVTIAFADIAPITPIAPIANDPAPAPTPRQKHHHHSRSHVATATAPTAPQATTDEGVLMVASKPPCELIVDGKATHLTTPQRSLALSAGSHAITFLNARQNIKKTVGVNITPRRPTKLIQNFMKT